MKSIALALSLMLLGSIASAADQAAAPAAAAASQTVSIIVKDLVPFDGGMVIKPEGGGKALVLNEAANNKVFTAEKMQKLQSAQESHTSINLKVTGNQVVDILN